MEQAKETQPTSESKATDQSGIWKRGLFMVFFVLVTRIVELIVGLIALAQFVTKLVSGRPIAGLVGFGEGLSQYLAQIVRFQSFGSEERPYPFAPWPGGQAKSAEQGSGSQSSASGGEGPSAAAG
jgi:hypothetical protein